VTARSRLIVLSAFLAGLTLAALGPRLGKTPVSPTSTPPPNPPVANRFLDLEARLNAETARDFAPELDAAPWDEFVVQWWEQLLHHPDSWTEPSLWHTAAIQITTTTGPDSSAGPVPHGIARPRPFAREWTTASWSAQLRDGFAQGWRLRRSRWHLTDPPRPPHFSGEVQFELLLERTPGGSRASISGTARILDWQDPQRLGARIEIRDPRILLREGPPLFTVETEIHLPVPPHTPFCDPLLGLLQSDGATPELILPGASIRIQPRATGWQIEPIPGLPTQPLWAAAVADWNQDGSPDLLVAGSDGLRWIAGPDWKGPGTLVWKAPLPLRHPQVLAVSDIDGDGDPDVFIGQYKLPYVGGQFPTPWHDANDGFPCYLLLNEGPAGLRDITDSSGLGGRRHRRIYSASFADWTDDGRPDLVVVSDFAGVDLFENVGGNRFEDRTASLGRSRHLFGMGHVTGDFNGDGFTDLFAIGMDSPVADRLGRLGLHHPASPEDVGWRSGMTFGNRLWLGGPAGLQMSDRARELARGGWAWAVTAEDFNRDGRMDFHLCNGHETRAGVRDYERQFWLQDIHAASSTPDPVAEMFFRNVAGKRAADSASYGGWQHGALFLSGDGDGHTEAGWVAGSAVFADTRNAVSLDFNQDGRMDLAITTFEEWPTRRQRLILLRNTGSDAGNWVGFRFSDRSGLDSRIRIRSGNRTQERRLTAGESHRSQSAGQLHFGLGNQGAIDSAEIRLPNQPWRSLPLPRLNQWNRVDVPRTPLQPSP